MKRIRTAWLLVGLAGCGCTVFEPPRTLRIPPAPLCHLPAAHLGRPAALADRLLAVPAGPTRESPAAALDRPVPAAKTVPASSADASAKQSEWAIDAG
jgi:hypothetical protein